MIFLGSLAEVLLILKRFLIGTSDTGDNNFILFYQVANAETVQFKCSIIARIIDFVFVRWVNSGRFESSLIFSNISFLTLSAFLRRVFANVADCFTEIVDCLFIPANFPILHYHSFDIRSTSSWV